ncbi:MAG: Bor family protein [Candidatus Latescibacteria bacterium]|nr:Bor family protein [Candidatus Latescibacterota bacterium]
MRRFTRMLLLCVVVFSGCYAATIETGKTPSTRVVENNWAAGWIYGLVPPKVVATANLCPGGVAKVQTMLSFPNQLVRILTLGIYTPMTIRVTCALPQETSQAESENVLSVSKNASVEEFQDIFQAAAEKSVKSEEVAFVILK